MRTSPLDTGRLELDVPDGDSISARLLSTELGSLPSVVPKLERLGERGRAKYLASAEPERSPHGYGVPMDDVSELARRQREDIRIVDAIAQHLPGRVADAAHLLDAAFTWVSLRRETHRSTRGMVIRASDGLML